MVEIETRFTARIRKFQGITLKSEGKNTRWKALCSEIRAKCEKDEYGIIDANLKAVMDRAIGILGTDSNWKDQNELAIKLYKETSEFVRYEAVTKAYDEIDNVQKLKADLDMKTFQKVELNDVRNLLESVKKIQMIIADYKPWTGDFLKNIKSPYDAVDPLCEELKECMEQLNARSKMLKKEANDNDFHMCFDTSGNIFYKTYSA